MPSISLSTHFGSGENAKKYVVTAERAALNKVILPQREQVTFPSCQSFLDPLNEWPPLWFLNPAKSERQSQISDWQPLDRAIKNQ